MTLSRIIFATMNLFISTNANAQLLPDLNAMDKLLGDTVRQLQKELDDMNTEQTTETNSEEEAEKQAEEKRKQEEAEKQAEAKKPAAETAALRSVSLAPSWYWYLWTLVKYLPSLRLKRSCPLSWRRASLTVMSLVPLLTVHTSSFTGWLKRSSC